MKSIQEFAVRRHVKGIVPDEAVIQSIEASDGYLTAVFHWGVTSPVTPSMVTSTHTHTVTIYWPTPEQKLIKPLDGV